MPRRVALLLVAGCHVTARTELTRPSVTELVRHREAAVARSPSIVLDDAGRLRFVEPLECPTEAVATEQRGVEVVTRPNLATFVVGVIATGLGGVLAIRGGTDDAPGTSPYLYAGVAGLAVGLPFAIGPWLGNGTELRMTGDAPVRRPGPSEPCGERALAARSAVLAVRGVEVHGAIDRDGGFAVSPFQLFDAFEPPPPAIEVTATVETPAGARTVTTIVDGNALATRAAAFLALADFEARIEPLRQVPGLVPGTLRVSLTTTAAGPAVRIALPLRNDGPGPAWAVRGHLVAPAARAIDGRVLYVGHVPKGTQLTRELLIPVADAGPLRNATLDVALELRDAHGTAPATPVRFRGAILVDAPR
jgi:hypothetical protein